jgi:hypothetical protein
MRDSAQGHEEGRVGPVIDDFDQVVFRRRSSRHRHRQDDSAYRMLWIGLALVGAVVLVVLVRALLDRTSATAGSSAVPEQSVASQPEPVPAAYAHSDEDVRSGAPRSMVYRCVGKGGAISFQSQRCSGDQRETKAIYAPAEAEPVRRVGDATPSAHTEVVYTYAPPRSDAARDQQRANCAIAKATREETLERVGLNRTYDLLQRLDEMVREACKGRDM